MTNDDAKERRRKYSAEWKRAEFAADPESVRERHRKWAKANRERRNAQRREAYAKDPSRRRQAARQYRDQKAADLAAKRRTEEYRAKARAAAARRREKPGYALSASIRARIHKDLGSRGLTKSTRTQRLLGYTTAELMDHLEKQFLPGMTWENFGEWHIDHIIALSRFQYTSENDPEFKAAWALSNLRPLWGRDNQRKSNKNVFLL